MCGFAGFLSKLPMIDSANSVLSKMASAIAHRGPDDFGVWYDPVNGVGLSHRRLAIVDLSPAGHQPMFSKSMRYVIAFNGEIYNHLKIREELSDAGVISSWCGHSDTETVLAAFEHWGVEKAIVKMVGMFSIAVCDLQAKELILARDRMGEKPLYYAWMNGAFLFGSELKAMRAHPMFDSTVDRDALALFMEYSYVPAPYSIYKSVRKLKPGCLLKVQLENPERSTMQTYWSLKQISAGTSSFLHQTDSQILDQLHLMIKESVRNQMMSDVPLGAFLSGGVDSTLIVAMMQSMAASPVKTFTIGFAQEEFDEAKYAAQVAAHIGTEHTELYISDQDAVNVVPKLASIYDEPFADSSQIPTYLVSALAKQKVTVALSGDAGDELFSGYTRYQHCADSWKRVAGTSAVTKGLIRELGRLSPFFLNQLANFARIKTQGQNVGHRLAKLAKASNAENFVSFYQTLISHTTLAQQLVPGSGALDTVFTDLNNLPAKFESMMLVDSLSYLPDDILAKVDRASMSVSLESRIPFLDFRLVEFAQHIPQRLKVNSGQTKWCLRQILDKYVPRTLLERPKKGFGVPLAAWLRGPLKDWGEALLEPSLLQKQNYLDCQIVRKMWMQHQNGVADWHFQLWNILVFQQWLTEQHMHGQ